MILTCKFTVSRSTNSPIMSLWHEGHCYYKTLGDLDGIKRLRDWATQQKVLIDTRTLPKV